MKQVETEVNSGILSMLIERGFHSGNFYPPNINHWKLDFWNFTSYDAKWGVRLINAALGQENVRLEVNSAIRVLPYMVRRKQLKRKHHKMSLQSFCSFHGKLNGKNVTKNILLLNCVAASIDEKTVKKLYKFFGYQRCKGNNDVNILHRDIVLSFHSLRQFSLDVEEEFEKFYHHLFYCPDFKIKKAFQQKRSHYIW